MFLTALFMLQVVTPPPSDVGSDIVITGKSPEVTGDALAACLARRCPPLEDIAATLVHAETLFVAGDYKDAQAALGGSIKRNRRHAAELPVEVAGLHRAFSRVSGHLGEPDREKITTFATIDALKAGLPAGDPRILAQRLETGDMQARQGQIDMALRTYRTVIGEARRSGEYEVEGHARLRLAAFYGALASINRSIWSARMRSTLRDLAATPQPELAPFRDAGRVLEARLAAEAGDTGALDRLIATMRATDEKPVLLHAPAMVRVDADAQAVSATGVPIGDYYPDQWVDIAFWIERDGTVGEPAVLRESDRLKSFWLPPVLRQIAGRRYAPLSRRQLRVERYTRTADWVSVTRTRVAQRSGVPRIEMLDLTQ